MHQEREIWVGIFTIMAILAKWIKRVAEQIRLKRLFRRTRTFRNSGGSSGQLGQKAAL
jgi:hypothetical protein